MSENPIDPVAHLAEMLKGFTNAMVVTRRDDGRLRSRPMAIAEAQPDGVLYFATAIDSPKVEELAADGRVNVSLQSAARYVSITGRARVVKDRALIDRLWSEAWRVWFPGGKDDPRLCLLAIEPEEAEYWDQSGAQGLKSLFRAAKAYVTGTTPPEFDPQQHAKVRT